MCRRAKTVSAPDLFSCANWMASLLLPKDTGEVRSYAEYAKGPKTDRRFKVADMFYKGELEY